jgi:hypothetical protein
MSFIISDGKRSLGMAIAFLAALAGIVAFAGGLVSGASVWTAFIWSSSTGVVTALLVAWGMYRRKYRSRDLHVAEHQPEPPEISPSQQQKPVREFFPPQ